MQRWGHTVNLDTIGTEKGLPYDTGGFSHEPGGSLTIVNCLYLSTFF